MKGLWRILTRNWQVKDDTVAASGMQELGRVVPDATRCVQCGVCGYNCPVGIPVRDYARQGLPVADPACITCGNCIEVCPRGTLRWETAVHGLVAKRFAPSQERR